MMVKFVDPLKVVEVGDGTVWKLISDLRCELEGQPDVVVPSGFHTDFASIPRIVRSLVSVLGRQNRPSVLHDWYYVTQPCTRKFADQAFLAGMRSTGVPLVKRSIMYVAVRIGGWVYWRR